jgi:hypothetical protein
VVVKRYLPDVSNKPKRYSNLAITIYNFQLIILRHGYYGVENTTKTKKEKEENYPVVHD